VTDHGPGRPEQDSHRGGKGTSFRVACTAQGCDYSATAATLGRAVRRVTRHATDRNGVAVRPHPDTSEDR